MKTYSVEKHRKDTKEWMQKRNKGSDSDPYTDQMKGYFNSEISAAMDMFTLKNLAFNETWVYIACSAVAKKISRQWMRVHKELISDGKVIKKPLDNHTLNNKIWRPNDYESYSKFMFKIAFELSLMGNAIIWKMRFHKQMILLPTELVQIEFDKNGSIKNYVVNASYNEDFAGLFSGSIIIFPEDIIHISLPNPNSMIWGLSVWIPGRKSVLFDRYSSDYLLDFYLKQANPGPVLELGEAANENQALKLLKSMEAKYIGRRNQRRTMILPKGVTAKNITNTLAEQQLKEHLLLKRQDIIGLLQIPPHEFGMQESGSLGSNETDKQLKNFYESTIIPYQMLIADSYTLSFEKDLGKNSFFEFDNSDVAVLKDNENEKADIAIKHLNFKTINEVRKDMYQLPPIQGGDTLRTQTNPFLNTGLQQRPEEQQTQIEEEKKTQQIDEKKLFIDKNADWYSGRKKQEGEELSKSEMDVFKTTLNIFADKAEDSIKRFKEIYKGELKAAGDPNEEKLRKALNSDFKQYEEVWVDGNIKTLQKTMEIGYDVSLNLPFNLPNQEEIEALRTENENKRRSITEARAIDAFKTFSDTTINDVLDKVNKGVSESKTLDEIAKDLLDYFTLTGPNRAKTIARTEVLIANSLGQKAAFDDAKEVIPGLKKMWVTAGDDRVRSFAKGDNNDHAQLDGVKVAADEDFKTPAGYTLEFPRDPRGPAGEIINCRCFMLMVPPEDELE